MAPQREPMARINEIRAKGDELAIDLYGTIGGDWFFGGTTAESFGAALDENPNAKTIELRINSRGGIFSEAIAMRAKLRRHPATVNVEVDALAASAASLVAMAGDQITMHPGSYMMIHPARSALDGTAAAHEQTATTLRSIDVDMRDIYANRTGQTPETVMAAMIAETYYSATAAVEFGLADKVGGHAVALLAEDIDALPSLPDDIRAQMKRAPSARRTQMEPLDELATVFSCAPSVAAIKAKWESIKTQAAIAEDAKAQVVAVTAELATANATLLTAQVGATKAKADAIVASLRSEGRLIAGSTTEKIALAQAAAGDLAQLESTAALVREYAPLVPVGGRQSTVAGAPATGNLAPPPMRDGAIDFDAIGAKLPAKDQALYGPQGWQLVLGTPAATSLWEKAGFQRPGQGDA